MQNWEQSFAERGIQRGGTLYLKASDALDFIEAAGQAERPVLGVDAFIITEQRLSQCWNTFWTVR